MLLRRQKPSPWLKRQFSLRSVPIRKPNLFFPIRSASDKTGPVEVRKVNAELRSITVDFSVQSAAYGFVKHPKIAGAGARCTVQFPNNRTIRRDFNNLIASGD